METNHKDNVRSVESLKKVRFITFRSDISGEKTKTKGISYHTTSCYIRYFFRLVNSQFSYLLLTVLLLIVHCNYYGFNLCIQEIAAQQSKVTGLSQSLKQRQTEIRKDNYP